MEQNWLEVCIKDGESIHTFYGFETWEQILTEMDEVWDNDLYEFHCGGPAVKAKIQPTLPVGEKFGFLSRCDGAYVVAVEVPQHYGQYLN